VGKLSKAQAAASGMKALESDFQFGRCDICEKSATWLVRDEHWELTSNPKWVKVTLMGEPNHFCDEHIREAQVTVHHASGDV
jgi:hypothetical protein